MAHMALDHASMFYNAERWGGAELATHAPGAPADMAQFLTRFSGVAVAPGFCFMAGFMAATTSAARERRGVPSGEISQRLIIRGLVLIAADALIAGYPRLFMGFYSFMVLSCLGVSLIAIALLRHVKTPILLALAVAIIVFHPLMEFPSAIDWILHTPSREGFLRSLYPVFPWFGVMLFGFVVGRDSVTRKRLSRFWVGAAVSCLLGFFAVRLPGGFGNAYTHDGIGALNFWFFSKYPPDLAWLSWSFWQIFLALAVLRQLTTERCPPILEVLSVFGRVSFFFYLTHFYVLALAMPLVHGGHSLGFVYAVWLLLLALMYKPCQWYLSKKTTRGNLITRYI